MISIPRLLGLVLAVSAGVADASTLFRCTDESGVVLYTNQKAAKKNCTVLSVQAAPVPRSSSPSPSVVSPTPGDFPRVSNTEQKARDGDRRAILERELATEQSALEKARQTAAQPNSPANARDVVALHERNVEALNKELAKLR